jgi:hypothetical protein
MFIPSEYQPWIMRYAGGWIVKIGNKPYLDDDPAQPGLIRNGLTYSWYKFKGDAKRAGKRESKRLMSKNPPWQPII